MEKSQHLHLLQSKLAAFAATTPNTLNLQIISSVPQTGILDTEIWEFLAGQVSAARPDDSPIAFEVKPVWLEPFPDRTRCVRWSGNVTQAAALKEWLTALSRFDYELGNSAVESDERSWHEEKQLAVLLPSPSDRTVSYFDGLLVLRDLMFKDGDLRSFVAEQKFSISEQQLKRESPVSFHDLLTTVPSICFVEIRFDVPITKVATTVLEKLYATKIGPRLRANLKNSTVTLDGQVYPLDPVYAAIVDQLIRAGGNPITRSSMRKNSQTLAPEERLDRTIGYLRRDCKEVGQLIQPEGRMGYLIPRDYLE